ncbi:hypothetical protein PIB30_102804, partial [Stylosanthes scabra]|nr:hypothetical protein [Stylosanthes scabra]
RHVSTVERWIGGGSGSHRMRVKSPGRLEARTGTGLANGWAEQKHAVRVGQSRGSDKDTGRFNEGTIWAVDFESNLTATKRSANGDEDDKHSSFWRRMEERSVFD